MQLTHQLRFEASERPTIGVLYAMLKNAETAGFGQDDVVSISAGENQRDGYYLTVVITKGNPS